MPGIAISNHLSPLAWDSAHFGFPVARIVPVELNEGMLQDTLAEARRDGVHLVYWDARLEWPLPHGLLQEFGGIYLNRRATFSAELTADGPTFPESQGLVLEEFARGPATLELLNLAVAAGIHSRFRVDPRIQDERFTSLFHAWMNRSTRRELADVVLIASSRGAAGETVMGVVTLSETDGHGRISLIATRAGARGQGVGTRLMAAAHTWFHERGATRATVVTQRENLAACRFYERCGYKLTSEEQTYHFWLQNPPVGR